MMSLPSRTPVTDRGGIVRHVPSRRAIATQLVPTIIAQITGTSALILVAISASGLVLTNVMATTATGNATTGLMVTQCQICLRAKSRHAQHHPECPLLTHSRPERNRKIWMWTILLLVELARHGLVSASAISTCFTLRLSGQHRAAITRLPR